MNKIDFMVPITGYYFTDYPLNELGDVPHRQVPVRKVKLLDFDGDEWCKVIVEDEDVVVDIKYFYLYANLCDYENLKPISREQVFIDLYSIKMTESTMTNETQLLQELQKLEKLEKSKTPCEKAYKLIFGGFPITDGTGNEFDELAWNAFRHGYYAGRGDDD